MENQHDVAGPDRAFGRQAWRARVRLRLSLALALSLYLHAFLIALELGDPGFGWPGFAKPRAERRVQAPDITVRLEEAPRPQMPVPPAVVAAQAPKPAPPLRAGKTFEFLPPVTAPAPPPAKPPSRPRRESAAPAPAARERARKPEIRVEPQPEILAQSDPQEETFSVPPEEEASRKAEVERRKEEEAQQLALEEARRKSEVERRKEDEQRLVLEEARRKEEEQRLALEEARRKEEEQRLALQKEQEAIRKAEVERRKEEEAQRLALEEARRKAEDERRKEETRRQAEEAAARARAQAAPGALSGKELAAKVLGQLRAPGGVPLDPPLPRSDPSRRRTISGPERDVVLRMYVESWRSKIERNGALNYRPMASRQARDYPVVTVAIRSDGSLEDVLIHRSSGLRELDEAVRRIARLYAPYSVFPPEVARQYDVIEIRRVWQFGDTLSIMEETR